MRGRKPAPTALKLIRGSRRVRDGGAEISAPGALCVPPGHLTPRQREIWHHALASAPVGLLREIDLGVLTIWVTAAALHAEAAGHVDAEGAIIAGKGQPYQNPWVSLMNRQALLMLRAAEQLGFSPAARSRISILPGAGEENPFEEFAP